MTFNLKVYLAVFIVIIVMTIYEGELIYLT